MACTTCACIGTKPSKMRSKLNCNIQDRLATGHSPCISRSVGFGQKDVFQRTTERCVCSFLDRHVSKYACSWQSPRRRYRARKASSGNIWTAMSLSCRHCCSLVYYEAVRQVASKSSLGEPYKQTVLVLHRSTTAQTSRFRAPRPPTFLVRRAKEITVVQVRSSSNTTQLLVHSKTCMLRPRYLTIWRTVRALKNLA